MIVFDLRCATGCDRFEAWFRSSADYEEQRRAGLVQCPLCRSPDVEKAPMAPGVPKKSGVRPLAALAAIQAQILKDSKWVGDDFVDTARAMHSGEQERRPVHGNASVEQAIALVEEGVPVAPLPLPLIPPDQVN